MTSSLRLAEDCTVSGDKHFHMPVYNNNTIDMHSYSAHLALHQGDRHELFSCYTDLP